MIIKLNNFIFSELDDTIISLVKLIITIGEQNKKV